MVGDLVDVLPLVEHVVEEGVLVPVAEVQDAAAGAGKATGCALYLLENHKFFLHEMKEGEAVLVETRVLAWDAKRFHLNIKTLPGEEIVVVAEMIERY